MTPLILTIIALLIVAAGACIAGWSLGFDQGWDRRLGRANGALDAVPDHAAESAILAGQALAFDRGVVAGEHRERERQRQVRSVAGHKATETRRNKHTGEVLPVTPGLIGTLTGGSPTADAGEGAEA